MRRPRKRRERPLVLLRARQGDPQCMQMLHRRRLVPVVEGGDGKAHYHWLGYEECRHRGKMYLVNGYHKMVICWCCARRLQRRGVQVENET